ncbi:MAG TPA: universal stress protein [Polyangiaceae bacterium]
MLIVHTAAFPEDETALAHATALAVRHSARLVSIHACAGPEQRPELPSAGPLLQRWGFPADSVAHDRVIHECCDDTVDTLLDAFRELRPDLVVSATHARSGVARLLLGSVAESVARNVGAPTLLLPIGGAGFVQPASGRVDLRRILVPAGSAAEARRALDVAHLLARGSNVREPEIVLLHVDDGLPLPRVETPPGSRVTWRASAGSLDAVIPAMAQELDVSLVIMATHGHDGFSDVLLGSVTERVLHELERPLLWVPMTAGTAASGP